ncbi:MAG: hypothetical protein DWQ07_19145 [Chloroflexi bacterium]|nr:MAG: hypothetical protein DWQ07_19145 [Chloroflexota bacterium]MBL1195050.1 hypothetical protein [Chloroflexota bacterium]NOH12338.1 SRPBCC family protein [Chloroflexota bacterium]
MAIQTEHQFSIDAPIEKVWKYFSDPPKVVPCLPGAELTEIIGDGMYKGDVGFRFGQINARFSGTAEITGMDNTNHTMTLRTKGDQQGATSRAEAEIWFSCQETDSQTTLVTINSEISISGRLAQLGGSMIQSISKYMFDRFAKCVQEVLST